MIAVPFYAYEADDTHCFQASFRMVLKYFLPERDFSWPEMDKLTGKIAGKATWPQRMLINLKGMGFTSVMIEGFDPQAFLEQGAGYLRKAFGDETADWQIRESDLPKEQADYKELLEQGIACENRLPELADIKHYLDQGYLVIAVVNSRRLNGKDGYVGHAVVIYDITDSTITIHDPGPPALQSRSLSYQEFESAWAYPNAQAKNIIATKYTGDAHV